MTTSSRIEVYVDGRWYRVDAAILKMLRTRRPRTWPAIITVTRTKR